MKQSFFFYQLSLQELDGNERDRVYLKLSTAVSEIVYQSSMVRSQRPWVYFYLKKKED